jgi:hypothetical protein
VFLFLAVAVDFTGLAAWLDNTAIAVSILADSIAWLGLALTITIDFAGHMTRLNHPAIAVSVLADVAAAAARDGRLFLRVGLSRIAVGHWWASFRDWPCSTRRSQ